MGKIRFMAGEFFRSFRKSLLKNLLLMAIFSISLVMAVLMSSYYLDLGEREEDWGQQLDDGSIWYDLEISRDSEEISNTFYTIQGCQNMLDYYERLRRLDRYPIFSAFTQQQMDMKEEELKPLFGDRDYRRFLVDGRTLPMSAYVGDQVCSIFSVKCAQMDDRAYGMFGLRTQEGEGFTEQNLTLDQATDAVPVLLGSEYKGIISVGQTMELYLADYCYPCCVAGILEPGSQCPEDGSVRGYPVELDSYIVFPYGIRVKGEAQKVEEIEKYAFLAKVAVDNGFIQIPDERNLTGLVNELRDTAQEYGLPPVRVTTTSTGLNLFRKESAVTIRILLILTVTIIGFAFYGLFVTFYDKIQSNKSTYGIYLMNGCSTGLVMLPCLLEIAVILFPSLLISRWVFVGMGANQDAILRTVYVFAGLAFLAGAVFVLCVMRGVDTEQVIRQKE